MIDAFVAELCSELAGAIDVLAAGIFSDKEVSLPLP